jgi:hypothetical protein
MQAMSERADESESKVQPGLGSCEGGAIVVFGIFFAVLVLGMLYYFVGIAATIYYRERLQDAADATAFASAIVHARGMNTIALINMVMAAILSVLVTLRLIEALIIVAEAVLYSMSWFFGATAAIATALEQVRQTVVTIREEAEPIVENVLKVLHVAGNVVRVVTPIGSNAGVLTSVNSHYDTEVQITFAMPARLTLPVEDDTYPYLCGKAGVMAISLAMLPLTPILPGFVETGVRQATQSLVEAGSDWFCNGKGEAPSVTVKPEAPLFPRSDDAKACMQKDKPPGDSMAPCKRAEEFDAYSTPDEEGRCRAGDQVCKPMKDTDPPFDDLPFRPESWCGSEGAGLTIDAETHCATVPGADGRTVADEKTPYGARLRMARAQCKPDGKKNNYRFEQRELLVQWQRDKSGEWKEVGEPVPVGSPKVIAREDGDKTNPCQVGGIPDELREFGEDPQYWPLSQEWNAGPITDPVCVAEQPKPTDQSVRTIERTRIEVLQIISCSEPAPPEFKQKVDAVNLSEDRMHDIGIGPEKEGDVGGAFQDIKLDESDTAAASGAPEGAMESGSESGSEGGEGGGDDSVNTNPFRFEKGHLLGTSDMQIRSLSLGRSLGASELNDGAEAPDKDGTAHTHAKRVVEMTKWRATGGELSGLATASETWGRFAVAQAEYYFDTGAEHDKGFADWSGDDGERDYLWFMGWTARMRRFRLSWKVDGKSADGASAEEGNKSGSEQNMNILSMFGGDGADPSSQKDPEQLQESGPGVACGGNQDCQSIASDLPSFDSLFLH